MKAQLLKQVNGYTRMVWDTSARATARLLAGAKDEIYQVVFPTEKAAIESILKDRPLTRMKNWDGESVNFLKDENKIVEEIIRSKI